tara:strand:- start:561 stop:2414 length:1854 start_codon:yes stop_codon:yes gene_type:complete
MDINGFDVENYNVYGIPTKAKTSTCPKCSEDRKKKTDKCMSVFWDTGLGQCNHCGERVQLHTYKKKDIIKIYNKPKQKPKSDLSKTVIDWFKNERSISEQTLIDLKVSEGKKWMPKAGKAINTIEFNYFLFDELINIKSRGKNKDFMFEKECELIMYNIDSIIGQKEAFLVEGEPDVLAYVESGLKHVASVPNGFTLPRPDGTSTINLNYLDDYFGVLEPIDKFYLAFDNDLAGLEGQKEFIRRLGAEKCYLIDFKDCKDANDYLNKYGKDALRKTKEDAKQVPLNGIEQIKDIKEELIDFWKNGAERGATIDLPGFDECASFEMKQYTLLLSAPGSGKSDFIDHICAKFAVKYDWKIGICSPENNPTKFHYDKIVRKIMGNRPKDDFDSEYMNEMFDYIDSHYVHIKQQSRFYLEDVLEKFAELVKRKGVRIFILDPFNKIKLKKIDRSKINEYTEEYHIMIDEFCKKYDCHIFLVLHPNKIQMKRLDKDNFSEKTFKMPTAYDAKGGGEHFDMSYNIIGLVRDFERNMVQIRTLKWKFQHLGTTGIDNWFGWNINNGRYTPPNDYYDETTMSAPNFTWDNKSWLRPNDANTQIESKVNPVSPIDAFEIDRDDIPF